MKAIRVINNELIEIMEYKNPRICFNNYELDDIENYCVFKETINPFQLYKELQRKDNIIDKAIEYFEYQLSQLYFEKDTMAKMLCAMALVILRGEDE